MIRPGFEFRLPKLQFDIIETVGFAEFSVTALLEIYAKMSGYFKYKKGLSRK